MASQRNFVSVVSLLMAGVSLLSGCTGASRRLQGEPVNKDSNISCVIESSTGGKFTVNMQTGLLLGSNGIGNRTIVRQTQDDYILYFDDGHEDKISKATGRYVAEARRVTIGSGQCDLISSELMHFWKQAPSHTVKLRITVYSFGTVQAV